MKELVQSHSRHIYLKPGELVIAKKPSLVTTLLGSCVAVTFFSPSTGVGAICHAMLPNSTSPEIEDYRYVDSALNFLYQKMCEYNSIKDAEVKLFGGANMLGTDNGDERMSVGGKNIKSALAMISSLGLTIVSQDIGGFFGRKLLFCTREGSVYMRRFSRKSGSDI